MGVQARGVDVTPGRHRPAHAAPIARRPLRIRDQYLVVAGQAAGQVAMLGVTPVLTRAFTPTELGGYQVATAIALVLLPLTTLRYEFVIPVSRSGARTRRIVRRSVYAVGGANTGLCAASLVALAFGSRFASLVLVMTAMINLMYSWTAIDNALLVRVQQTKSLAVRNVLAGLFSCLLQLLIALVFPSVLALASAVLVGRIAAIVLTRGAEARTAPIGDGADDVGYGPKRVATVVTSELVAGAVIQGLTLVTAPTLGRAASAFVATAQRVSGVPASLVGQGIGQAVQLTAAKAVNTGQGRLMPGLRKAGTRVAAFAFLVGVAVAALGPVLAVPVLGTQWAPVGAILPLIAAPVALRIVASALGPVLVMIRRERVALVQQVIQLVVGFGAAGVTAVLTGSLAWTVAAFGVVAVVTYAVYLASIVYCVREFDARRANA